MSVINQPTKVPSNKVTAASLGAVLTESAIQIIQATTSFNFEPTVQVALTTLVVFVLGYFVKERT